MVAGPLVQLYWPAGGELPEEWSAGRSAKLLWDTLKPVAAIAAAAVVLGYLPAKLFASAGAGGPVLLACLLGPLLLPKYVMLYAWRLLLAPTSAIGRFVANNPTLDDWADPASAVLTLVLWYWPLAALVMGAGMRSLDRDVLDAARLEGGRWRRFWRIELRMMLRPIALAFGVCLVLALSEFATFHLAQMTTIGSELGLLNERLGWLSASAETVVARAAWPLALAAVIAGAALWRRSSHWLSAGATEPPLAKGRAWLWAATLALVGLSLAAPIGLLVANLESFGAIGKFITQRTDYLVWPAVTASVAAALAMLLAGGAVAAATLGRAGRVVGAVLSATILAAMFLPGALIGMAVLKMSNVLAGVAVLGGLTDHFIIVSAVQAVRFAGVALIVLMFARASQSRQLSDAAAVDGASARRAFWHVHLPRTWPAVAGAFIVVAMLSLTELSATKLVLPPGLPFLAQFWLNEMHFGRQQEVIASALALLVVYAGAVAGVIGLIWLARRRAARMLVLIGLLCLTAAGCDSTISDEPDVKGSFGRTGRGAGEFIYPRAIDRAADGSLYVVDKTGRIQHLTKDGVPLGCFNMPEIKAGKPTGLTVGPDGNIYLADTHYSRVIVLAPDGKEVRRFGSFGTGDGEFIYPTDVAFAPDGRMFVSEYGGADRVSIYSAEGKFLTSFGGPGEGPGEFARPAALCVDAKRGVLYVADACNHRIAKYNLDGQLQGYMGSAGRGEGELRYPYDLALMADGSLLVCEFGANRLQVFSPAGESLGVVGSAGRRLGQLAYPWGVAVDEDDRAYVVDAGNNRVQIWQLR